MFRHIVSCLHIHNTLVSILTDTTRLFIVVVTYYHTIVYVTSNHCIIAINEYKGDYHLIIYFKIAVCDYRVEYRCYLLLFIVLYLSNFYLLQLNYYTVLIFTPISFLRLTNKKVSRYFDLTNTTTQLVHHVKYHLLNLVLHFIANWT